MILKPNFLLENYVRLDLKGVRLDLDPVTFIL